MRRVGPLVSLWKAEIETARTGSNDPRERDVQFWREAFRTEDPVEKEAQLYALIDETEKLGDDGVEFFDRAIGKRVGTLEYVDEWIAALQDTPKTKDMKRSFVHTFAEDFKTIQSITRPEVRRWVDKALNEGNSLKTIKRKLSFIRSYWDYLTDIGVVSEDNTSLMSLKLGKAAKRSNPAAKTKAFTAEEVVAFKNAVMKKGDHQLSDLITLAMWSGCRIEELCSLRVDKVSANSFEVEDAKTEAGWRVIPIHSKLTQTMTRLSEASTDGYVLCGLSKNKYEDRSNAIGKRFGRIKTAMGFNPRVQTFHSIRKTVATSLKDAGVLEAVAADIIGHDHETMTYGLYTGTSSVGVMSEALEKIDFPSALAH